MSIKPIHDIENMQPEAIELLEAAGYMDANTIFDHKISDITSELVKANKVLEIIDTEPTHTMVVKWLKPLEAKFGKNISKKEDVTEVDPAMLIEPKDVLNTPYAIPVSENFIEKNHLDLTKIPFGILRFLDKEQAIKHAAVYEDISSSYNVVSDIERSEIAETKNTSLLGDATSTNNDESILDKKRMVKMDTLHKEDGHVAPKERTEDINLTKTTRKETNAGVNPNSKFYIKGVLHKSVNRFKYGCHAFILANILIFLSFAITSLVILDSNRFAWAAWAPLLGVIGLLIYFTAAQKATCPICNQKQFALKYCLKHRNAHHWPIFGYMLPTALHALSFKWLRCIFCGTAVRLKE